MNPVGQEGNVFANLFDKVPAKRAGSEEDMAGAILYLASRAGVSCRFSGVRPISLIVLIGVCGRGVTVHRRWPDTSREWPRIKTASLQVIEIQQRLFPTKTVIAIRLYGLASQGFSLRTFPV